MITGTVKEMKSGLFSPRSTASTSPSRDSGEKGAALEGAREQTGQGGKLIENMAPEEISGEGLLSRVHPTPRPRPWHSVLCVYRALAEVCTTGWGGKGGSTSSAWKAILRRRGTWELSSARKVNLGRAPRAAEAVIFHYFGWFCYRVLRAFRTRGSASSSAPAITPSTDRYPVLNNWKGDGRRKEGGSVGGHLVHGHARGSRGPLKPPRTPIHSHNSAVRGSERWCRLCEHKGLMETGPSHKESRPQSLSYHLLKAMDQRQCSNQYSTLCLLGFPELAK